MQEFLKTLTSKQLTEELDKIAVELEQTHNKFIKSNGKNINLEYRLNRLYCYYKNLGDELCKRSISSVTQE